MSIDGWIWQIWLTLVIVIFLGVGAYVSTKGYSSEQPMTPAERRELIESQEMNKWNALSKHEQCEQMKMALIWKLSGMSKNEVALFVGLEEQHCLKVYAGE